ncbi:hypothetical protein EJ419_06215 [Alloscardovia theropitheci]|uniref:Uncharacterized protein n=1 Tax=Alloscardovia theropitheci TaxID=2496842 RepID=A0A4R0QNT4_9BIFI|nr:hypothetical protein [Alloscardovia theropitheci]TCD53844.1 hypothetical protein EJ419_06215 [Alloscardovia theropitheci]
MADENFNKITPLQIFTGTSSTSTFPEIPTPVLEGYYSLEVTTPAQGIDPDGSMVNVVCDVNYHQLGQIQLIDEGGNVVAERVYANHPSDPSQADATPLPGIPSGWEIIPGQDIHGYDPTSKTVNPNDIKNPYRIGLNTIIRIRPISHPPVTPATPVTPVTPRVPQSPATPPVRSQSSSSHRVLARTGMDIIPTLTGLALMSSMAAMLLIVIRRRG